jgi:hypothetical protein
MPLTGMTLVGKAQQYRKIRKSEDLPGKTAGPLSGVSGRRWIENRYDFRSERGKILVDKGFFNLRINQGIPGSY